MGLLYNYKKRRDVKKEAKVEAGKKGKKGKKIDEKYQKPGSKGKKSYQASPLGNIIRKTFTKSKYGVKPVGRGGGQPLSKKDIGIQEDKSKRTDQKATTTKGLSKKTLEAVRRVGLDDPQDPGFKEAPEFKENIAKQSAYAKKKAEYDRKKKLGKYVSGSRTQQQRAKDASLDLARSRAIKEHGEGKGTRKLYKQLKKKKMEKLKQRRKSPMAKF